MFAVERLSSYITRGVSTVSGPFHPFGGAVDIIVVEQADGTFKSSPWYVRFGKFQGVLKAKEKVVKISVNGVDANFHMHLNQRGEAFFIREEDGEEYSSSSSDEADVQPKENTRKMKSKSCDYDEFNSNVQIGASNGKIMARTNSHQSRVLGLVVGQSLVKDDSYQGVGPDAKVVRVDSLERAEIAANLLEVKWSTNLATSRSRKDKTLRASPSNTSDSKADRILKTHDERRQVDLSVKDTIETRMGRCMLPKECKENSDDISKGAIGNIECAVEESGVEMSSLGTMKQVLETSSINEGSWKEKSEATSEIEKNGDELKSHFVNKNNDSECSISEVSSPDRDVPNVLEACPRKNFDDEQASDKRDVDVSLSSFDISEDENGSDRVQSFIHCKTSESIALVLDGSSGKIYETLYHADGDSGEVLFSAGTLESSADLLAQNTVIQQAGDSVTETKCVEFGNNDSQHEEMELEAPVMVSESYTHVVSVDPILGLVEEVESGSICTVSTFSNLDHQLKDEKTIRDELQTAFNSVADTQQVHVGGGQGKTASISLTESSDEEQFLFSDLDESKLNEILYESVDVVDKENDLSFCSGSGDCIKEVTKAFITNDESYSPMHKFVQENPSGDLEILTGGSKVTSSPIGIRKVQSIPSVENGRLVESLPVNWSCMDNLDTEDLQHPLCHSLDSPSEPLERILHGNKESYFINVDAASGNQLVQESSNSEEIHNSGNIKNSAAVGDPSKAIGASGGSWSLWPFSLRRSNSRKFIQSAISGTSSSENVSDNSTCKDGDKQLLKPEVTKMKEKANTPSDNNTCKDGDKQLPKPKVSKMKEKANTPTSEQLASLNLQEGRNVVTFTFSTAMLGKQKVDASIYLWKWNDRVVISDVDGTITKSDVLGQFMPMVGVDWSQTGVAHLFSAIKENGYQLLFLSARSISQAYNTRQFLINLKQDGKALPDGPVVISPDGLFPSLFREVIRRAPHEFKIGCLEDIKALFPSDRNPFYAGFGNRDTDEISYLKVGIPRGKIFIINPKGEVAVHRRVDTKSYTSLHALVHDMFPPPTSTEQEDFNSWNFWRLPPPDIRI